MVSTSSPMPCLMLAILARDVRNTVILWTEKAQGSEDTIEKQSHVLKVTGRPSELGCHRLKPGQPGKASLAKALVLSLQKDFLLLLKVALVSPRL